MKKLINSLAFALCLSAVPSVKAAVTVTTSAPTFGTFFDKDGGIIPLGGVSVGFFSSIMSAPDSGQLATLQAMKGWGDMLAAGWTDVRSLPGVVLTPSGTFNWAFPTPYGGTVGNIQLADLPTNTQLYIAAFNGGSFNNNGVNGGAGAVSTSWAGASQWALIKDGLSPADLGGRNILPNAGTNVVISGVDTGSNYNLVSIGAVPEPSRAILLGLGAMGLLFRRRRN